MEQDKNKIPNFILHHQNIFPQIQNAEQWHYFLESELGGIYNSIPWQKLEENIGARMPKKKSNCGKKAIFSLRGKIALMFLKSHSGLSDKDLIGRLNTDYSYQYFCNMIISPLHQIKDESIVSRIRIELSKYIDWESFQKILAGEWKKDMELTQISMQDATCYETSMRYPTDVKILQEGIDYVYESIVKICRGLKIRQPQNKYKEQKNKTLDYLKKRRKTYKETRRRVKSLLYLLNKLIGQIEDILVLGGDPFKKKLFDRRFPIIKKVLEQRKQWYETGEKPQDLIVSIDKPYIKPIVRGKENKRVEFGAKVNMLQVDGINFIEHLSFDAFHEGNRLKNGIQLHRSLFGRCDIIGADQIYATNKNRSYCSISNIRTNFKPKGPKIKNKDEYKQRQLLRKIINKERATTLEGSFGVEKEAYHLKKIRARLEKTEILWIYFGVHTRNASIISQKRKKKKAEQNPRTMVA